MNEDAHRGSKERAARPTLVARFASLEPNVRIGALVTVAIVVGIVIWLVAGRDSNESTQAPRSSARAASVSDLAALSASVRHPVYWAGPRQGYTYELTQTSDGRIYIRYLPPNVPVGSNKADYLTIATYPVAHALAAVRGIATRAHSTAMRLRGGGIAVQDANHPTSVYFAYPRSDYQVEVYDPSPPRALRLVVSGKVTPIHPVDGQSSAQPRSATLEQLRALQSSVGHSVYWVGPQAGTTYELTESGDGKIYIRYLPGGSKPGDRSPRTTVGTYPFRNPVAAVRAIAKQTGGRTFAVAGGGVAAVDGRHPTSVYVAFPRSAVEIEVFDPSAARARQLVASGRVAPVG